MAAFSCFADGCSRARMLVTLSLLKQRSGAQKGNSFLHEVSLSESASGSPQQQPPLPRAL